MSILAAAIGALWQLLIIAIEVAALALIVWVAAALWAAVAAAVKAAVKS